MKVTRRDVALLRAHLRHRLFLSALLTLTMPPWRKLFLLNIALQIAVRRRFTGKTRGDVVRFVAHARIRRGLGGPNKLEPWPAKQVIINTLTGTKTEGLTPGSAPRPSSSSTS